MADGQKLGGHAPSDMQPIKQPFYFQPSCGVAESRPDNQTATLFPGQMYLLLFAFHSLLPFRAQWITADWCMFPGWCWCSVAG